jgi:hypothetical protein
LGEEMTNSPCLKCGEVMHYTCFEVMEDEDNGLCPQCVKEELYNFLSEKKLLKEFQEWLNKKYNKNFEW